jgi:hypothetical protein
MPLKGISRRRWLGRVYPTLSNRLNLPTAPHKFFAFGKFRVFLGCLFLPLMVATIIPQLEVFIKAAV